MPKLLKAVGKRKVAVKKSVGEKPSGIVVVGNNKTRQLEWIRKNGVYNWPVRDGDEFAPEQFAKINELWLYANVKSQGHLFLRKVLIYYFHTKGRTMKEKTEVTIMCDEFMERIDCVYMTGATRNGVEGYALFF